MRVAAAVTAWFACGCAAGCIILAGVAIRLRRGAVGLRCSWGCIRVEETLYCLGCPLV